MVTLEPQLSAAKRELLDARRVALANAADATYQIADGRIQPLATWSGTVARLDDLIHLLDRIQVHHG